MRNRTAQIAWPVDCVSVHSAPDRLDIGLIVAAGCSLLAPAASLALGISPAWLPGSGALWRAAHLSAFSGLDVGPFTAALATQTLIFIAAALAWRITAQFAPQSGWVLPDLRADAQARDLFNAEAGGVLIYVARRQRAVRILVSPSLSQHLDTQTVEQARAALIAALQTGDEARGFSEARSLLSARP